MNGQLVYAQEIEDPAGQLSLDLNDLEDGTYILKIASKENERVQRIIIL